MRPDESFGELRSAIRQLCQRFPDEYWRGLDQKRGYPEAFVQALTEAGWLAALIPDDYGGSGLGVQWRERRVGQGGRVETLGRCARRPAGTQNLSHPQFRT